MIARISFGLSQSLEVIARISFRLSQSLEVIARISFGLSQSLGVIARISFGLLRSRARFLGLSHWIGFALYLFITDRSPFSSPLDLTPLSIYGKKRLDSLIEPLF